MAFNTKHANISHEPDDAEKAVSHKDDVSGSFDDREEPVSPEERRLLWRQDVRIISLCSIMYFLAAMDRSNIGNAKILNVSTGDDLQHTMGMSDYQFSIALMAFLIAYAVFEVPSNILLKKVRPSRWLAFLMFSWGAVTIGLGGARSFASLTALRFMLGMFEAGLFPGLIFYLTFWYRHDERSARVALILASYSVASAFGGTIAFGIGHLNGVAGLPGWRWLFIIEGIPSIIFAFVVLFFLPDFPETSGWMSEKERELAVRRLLHEGSKAHHPSMTWVDAKSTLTDWRLYVHYAIYSAIGTPMASLGLFTPSIVLGLGFHDLTSQLMTVPPCAITFVCLCMISKSADKFNARGYHTVGAAIVGAVGFILSAALPLTAYTARYGALIMAMAGSVSCLPSLLGWLTSNVAGTASVGLAIALSVSFGGLGQIPGVWIYKASENAKGYPTGHWTNAGLLLFIAIVSLGLRAFYERKNRQLMAEAKRLGVPARLYKL